MGFDLTSLLRARRSEGAELWGSYLNPQTAKVLRSIGFDRRWERAGGCYLYDDTGAKYLDYLSGFGVFGLGRDHPVVRQALHDVLDAELADMVQMDTPLLAGLLGEALIKRAPVPGPRLHVQQRHRSGRNRPQVRPVRHRAAPDPLLRPRLPRPHRRLAVGQRRQGVPRRLRAAASRGPRVPFGDLEALRRELRPATWPP